MILYITSLSTLEINNMKIKISIIVMALTIIASCSSQSVSRSVPREIHPDAKEMIEKLFTVNASNISLADENLEKKTLERFKKYAETGTNIEFIQDDTLIDETLFKIVPSVESMFNLVTIRYAKNAFYDHAATLNLIRYMESLFQEVYPSIFEHYNTAINNDLYSLHSITKLRKSVLTPLEINPDYDPINISQYNGYIQGELIIWNKRLAEMEKNLKKLTKK